MTGNSLGGLSFGYLTLSGAFLSLDELKLFLNGSQSPMSTAGCMNSPICHDCSNLACIITQACPICDANNGMLEITKND